MEKLKTIKQIVREVLEECPNARNSDKLLTILVYQKMGFKIWISDIKNSPSFESIRRARQYLQNTEGICPPEEDIDVMRNKRQLEYREVFTR